MPTGAVFLISGGDSSASFDPNAKTFTMKPTNPLDKTQQFKSHPAPDGGVYITPANSDLVLDVANDKAVAGNTVIPWWKKSGGSVTTANQRWEFVGNAYETKLPNTDKLVLAAGKDNQVIIENRDKVATPLKPLDLPPFVDITFINHHDADVTVTWDNTKITPPPSWVIKKGETSKVSLPTGYKFVAKNASGETVDPSPITVEKDATIEFKPKFAGKPVLKIDDKDFSTLNLAWSLPAGTPAVTEYILVQVAPEQQETRLSASVATSQHYNALANKDYSFKIVAVLGSQKVESEVVTINHKAQAPGKPCLGYQEGQNFSVNLSWTPAEDHGAPITKYTIKQISPEAKVFTVEGKVLSYPITVNPHVKYSFQVIATNAGGDSAPSNVISFTLTPPPPSKPVLTYERSGDSITLKWTSTANGPSPIVGYSLQQVLPRDDVNGLLEFDPNTTSHTFKPVKKVEYQFYVWATNSDGADSPMSNIVTFIIRLDKPKKPVLTFKWLAQDAVAFNYSTEDDGGSPITSYKLVQVFPKEKARYSGLEQQYEMNVPQITHYEFYVVAENAEGVSEPSTPVVFDVLRPDLLPGKIKGLSYTSGDTPKQYNLQWHLDAENKANPLPSKVRVVQETPKHSESEVPGTQASFPVTVTEPSTFYVVGLNSGGNLGEKSRTLRIAPGPIKAPQVSVSKFGTNATLTWPPVDGAVSYSITQLSPTSNDPVEQKDTTFKVTGKVGDKFSFMVYATDANGNESPQSNIVKFEFSGYVPDAPQLAYKLVGDVVHLDWNTPSNDGGLPIQSYTVVQTAPPPSKSYHMSLNRHLEVPMTRGENYTFEVFATNSAGDSLHSKPVTVIIPKQPPPAPVLSVVGKGDNYASLSWTAPTGTPPGTTYQVYTMPDHKTAASETTSTAQTISGLKQEILTYYFLVVAKSPDGETSSNTVTVTLDKKVPEKPPTPQLWGEAINNVHRLHWTVTNPTPGLVYELYELTSNQLITKTFATTFDVAVAEGVTYQWVVRAVTSDGVSSPNSNVVVYRKGTWFERVAGSRWTAIYPTIVYREYVTITNYGSYLSACKTIGDMYVPLGVETWRWYLNNTGSMRYAHYGYQRPEDHGVTFQVLNENCFQICEPGKTNLVWTRV